MAPQYLLTCTCKAQHPVSMTNAGETLSCTCGKTLDVPALRDMRHLPVAPPSDAESAPIRKWSLVHGLVFAAAVPLLLGCLAVAVRGYFYLRQIPKETPTVQDVLKYHPDALLRVNVDQLTPSQALKYWQTLHSVRTLSRVTDPPHVQYQKESLRLSRQIGFSITGALVCLAAILGTLMTSGGGKMKK